MLFCTLLDCQPHQILKGHIGCVNCLLYPRNDSTRYHPDFLVSGGADFTVVIWDITMGCKLHTFCVHGGEVTQLIVPPATCNVSQQSSLFCSLDWVILQFLFIVDARIDGIVLIINMYSHIGKIHIFKKSIILKFIKPYDYFVNLCVVYRVEFYRVWHQ